ncbi:MAG TPA: acyl-CoA dehydrogenase family protein [Candidatus Binatia bacterium]|jgi:hypothetical protein|nr:acyl-CoA dehydrogenase family protein [Candidatus Binatia bacterium]
MTQEVIREDLLERVQQLTPVIREHADRGEQERHLADPVVAALQEAGLYRMLVPRELGGLQVDPLTFYQVVEALARVDGSTGWCMFISGSAPLSVGFLQGEAAEAMCGKGTRMIQSATIFPLSPRWENLRAKDSPGQVVESCCFGRKSHSRQLSQ